jgi:hypothetical protein
VKIDPEATLSCAEGRWDSETARRTEDEPQTAIWAVDTRVPHCEEAGPTPRALCGNITELPGLQHRIVTSTGSFKEMA